MTDQKPFVQNTSDRKQVEDGARKVRAFEGAHKRDLAAVLSTVEGRRVWFRMMEEVAGLYTEDFDPNPYVAAFNQGVRRVGIIMRREAAELDPNVLVVMEKEYRDQEDRIHAT